MKPRFTMMVGLPGSGKSYETYRRHGGNSILSSDGIVDQIGSLFNTTYDETWKHTIKYASWLLDRDINDHIGAGQSFILDQTNLTYGKRASILSRIPEDWEKVCIYMDTPIDVIHKRLKNRPGKTIPSLVLQSMISSLQVPSLSEGYDELIILNMEP